MAKPPVSPARPASWRPRRIRLEDVPALFSEGPELEPPETTKALWPRVEAEKLRLTARWTQCFTRLADRSKNFWPNVLRA